MRIAMLVAAACIVGLVVGAHLLDEGELVHLTTIDADGRRVETPLWVVDVAGDIYVQARSPESRWWVRARKQAAVELERGGATRDAFAVSVTDPGTVAAVRDAFARKYGFFETHLRDAFAPADSVVVHIELREPAAPVITGPSGDPS